jgi:hypothetical protein
MKASDVAHKQRQLRKRGSRMIRLMYENPSPTNRLPMPHAPSDEEDSEPETFESIWDNKLIRQPTRIIGIEPMETHITIQPLEECIVLDLLIQRFLSWAHKAKAHPLACLPWILMHKEVQVLQVILLWYPIWLSQSI